MAEPVLPCPFCGAFAFSEKREDDWGWVVQCGGCFSTSNLLDTEETAIVAWNKRIPLKEKN